MDEPTAKWMSTPLYLDDELIRLAGVESTVTFVTHNIPAVWADLGGRISQQDQGGG
jgi:hypothetical protein